MTTHTTTLKAHARTHFYGMPACPCCGETVLAPEASVLVEGEAIHHLWSCDVCAFSFATVIALDARGPRASTPRRQTHEQDAAELVLW
jgi:C4-type Zn-finger protein